MLPLIVDRLPQIAELCRTHRIQSLDVFGSAATDTFDPETSDIDLICDPGTYEPGVSGRYFDFADALEALLGYKVDLLTVPMIRNRLVHGCDSVDYRALWDIVQRHVPDLDPRLQELLDRYPPSSFVSDAIRPE